MTPKGDKGKGEATFEQLLVEVEGIVGKLQDGSLPLEDALTLYETGYKQLKVAQQRLDQARTKLETLQKSARDEEGEA